MLGNGWEKGRKNASGRRPGTIEGKQIKARKNKGGAWGDGGRGLAQKWDLRNAKNELNGSKRERVAAQGQCPQKNQRG